jgi:DNA-binding transcriptional ArsR family regulator
LCHECARDGPSQPAVAAAALLADRTRASILRMLADGPTRVCELALARAALAEVLR